jgi:hypothetical protein
MLNPHFAGVANLGFHHRRQHMNEHHPTEGNQPTILGFDPMQTSAKAELTLEQEHEQAVYTSGISASGIGKYRPRRSGMLKLFVAKEQSTRGTPRRELLRAGAELQQLLLARNRKIACC